MIRSAAGKVPHVCIVGAGVAGLRCADVLLQHGVKVTILEGRDRVGGRFCQSNALGHLVDLGPNWIHGTDNNPILDLARETKTVVMNWDGRQSVFDHLGNQMPEKEAVENTEHVWAIIERAMKLSNDSSASIPAEKSLYSFFEEQVTEMFPSDVEGDATAKSRRSTILQMAEMWGAFVGSPIQRQSLKFFWLEECIDGENLFVAETYHKVLAKIAEPAMKATVKFGHVVKRIISNATTLGNGDSAISVEVEGKESETFDEVIMTAPLGWLKRNLDVFQPEIPARIKAGIDAISYGHLDKVYINFPTAFWNDGTSPDASSSRRPVDSGVPNVTATTAPLHQNQSDEPPAATINPSHWPGFTHWVAPSYAEHTNPSQWQQEAVNLAALPGSTAHPTLLFYIFGPTSIYIAKMLASNPEAKHQELLTEFFHPYFSRLPNYSADDPTHQPKAILATAWANDELSGYGSYCNFQVGLEKGDEDIEAMRWGMPERGVWLAGEHTAPFVALGTVTGAYWAGEGVAKRIVQAYGIEAVTK
ncbi:hypothetical protein NX059_001118 [Plenodomus lindquistii]|nr:hypothetical protein NX059_001118 [Plenodomus lindquistii]